MYFGQFGNLIEKIVNMKISSQNLFENLMKVNIDVGKCFQN